MYEKFSSSYKFSMADLQELKTGADLVSDKKTTTVYSRQRSQDDDEIRDEVGEYNWDEPI